MSIERYTTNAVIKIKIFCQQYPCMCMKILKIIIIMTSMTGSNAYVKGLKFKSI